jgi:hypothetical protein
MKLEGQYAQIRGNLSQIGGSLFRIGGYISAPGREILTTSTLTPLKPLLEVSKWRTLSANS